MPETQKSFKQEYLAEKLQMIGDKLDDAYGGPLLEELIVRMERTVAHFNEEMDDMLETLKSRTKNQQGLLASMRGDNPNLEQVELSDIEKKLESGEAKENLKEEKLSKPKKKLSFFKRKKKK